MPTQPARFVVTYLLVTDALAAGTEASRHSGTDTSRVEKAAGRRYSAW